MKFRTLVLVPNLFFLWLIQFSLSVCEDIECRNYTSRSTWDCVNFTFVIFVNCTSSSNGGSVSIDTTVGQSYISFSSCLFFSCKAPGYKGGGCFIDGGIVQFFDCCGKSCEAQMGSFLFFRNNGPFINSTIASDCRIVGGSSTDYRPYCGTLRFGDDCVPNLFHFNFSLCYAYMDGSCLYYMDDIDSRGDGYYYTIRTTPSLCQNCCFMNCTGTSAIANRVIKNLTFIDCLFVKNDHYRAWSGNIVSTFWEAVYVTASASTDATLTIKNSIFAENNGPPFDGKSGLYIIIGCMFGPNTMTTVMGGVSYTATNTQTITFTSSDWVPEDHGKCLMILICQTNPFVKSSIFMLSHDVKDSAMMNASANLAPTPSATFTRAWDVVMKRKKIVQIWLFATFWD